MAGRGDLAQGLSSVEEGQVGLLHAEEVRSICCSAPLPLSAVSLSLGRKVSGVQPNSVFLSFCREMVFQEQEMHWILVLCLSAGLGARVH